MRDGWKIDESGLTGDSLSNGFERETDMKEIEPKIPIAVIWVSPYFTPSKYSTESEYELIRQFSASIWYF